MALYCSFVHCAVPLPAPSLSKILWSLQQDPSARPKDLHWWALTQACVPSARTSNGGSTERERHFSAQSVLMKCLPSLSLCGIFPLTSISFHHLYSVFNILLCYKTANRPIYIIKLPEYFIALGFLFAFWLWFSVRAQDKNKWHPKWLIWREFNKGTTHKDWVGHREASKGSGSPGWNPQVPLLPQPEGERWGRHRTV